MNRSIPLAANALCLVLMAGLPLAAAGPAQPCQARNLGFDLADAGWRHQPLSRFKRDTVYTVEREGDRTVLTARADRSASLFVAPLARPMAVPQAISWSWKTDALVPGADNRDKSREDAPLRVIVAFDGDAESLPAGERTRRKLAGMLSGEPPPFAVLMYIWGDGVEPETIIPSAHTSQVKMLVVAAGERGLGAWQSQTRRLAADYRRAYGSEPGPLLSVGVMTDTDNTGTRALGRYADIRLDCGG